MTVPLHNRKEDLFLARVVVFKLPQEVKLACQTLQKLVFQLRILCLLILGDDTANT